MDSPTESGVKSSDVAKGSVILLVCLFLSRVLGLVRDTVLAAQYGISDQNDAYRIAFAVPDLIFMLLAGGGLSSAFIPVFADYLHTDREEEAWQVFSDVILAVLVVVSLLVIVLEFLVPTILTGYTAGRPEIRADAILMSRILLPAQIAFMVGSVFFGALYAQKKFLIPAIVPNVYNVSIITGALIGPHVYGGGIKAAAIGALVGAVIGNIILPLLVFRKIGGRFRPSFTFKHPGVKRFFILLLPIILGFSLSAVLGLVSQYFATPYGEGANTSVSAASTIMQAPVGIFGQSLALAIFPVLAQFVAQKRMDLYRDQISKTLRTAMFIAIPSAIFMAAMAEFLAHALYGYGQASGEVEKLALIANLVRVYAVGVPFWIAQSILIRGFFSLHQTLKPVVMGTIATVVFIGLCLGVKFAPVGTTAERLLSLAWAANISVAVLTAALYLSLEKLVGKLDFKGIAITTGKSMIAAGVAGALIFGGTYLFNINSKTMVFTFVLLAVAIGGGIFAGICKSLKMPETEYLDRMFAKMDKMAARFKKKPTA